MNANMHEKIIQSCQELLIDLTVGYSLPFYGNFLLFMNFYERYDIPTCGVNMTAKGMNFYYNPKFLDGKTQKEVNFIVIHEIYHLLWDHPKRTISGIYEPRLSNIAQDMIINHIIVEDILPSFIEIPRDAKGKNMALFVPKDYTGSLIFEHIYEWLKDEREKRKKEKQKEGDGNGNGKGKSKPGEGDSEGDGSYGPYGKFPSKKERDQEKNIDTYSLDHIFDNLDNNNGEYLDTHISDEIPEEMRDTFIKDAIDRLKARGFEEGNITDTLEKLRKKKKDYLSHIKRSLSNLIFGTKKTKTIIKPNRRNIPGIKGNKKVKTKINVILDTSGSMTGLIERVLDYVYRNDIEFNLIQADTNVRCVERIKNKKKLELVKLTGFGGTILMPAVNYVVDNFNNLNTCILTDGECDSLDLSQLRGSVLLISIGSEIPITATNGKVKQIMVEKTK